MNENEIEDWISFEYELYNIGNINKFNTVYCLMILKVFFLHKYLGCFPVDFGNIDGTDFRNIFICWPVLSSLCLALTLTIYISFHYCLILAIPEENYLKYLLKQEPAQTNEIKLTEVLAKYFPQNLSIYNKEVITRTLIFIT